jgi:hypothetical protein
MRDQDSLVSTVTDCTTGVRFPVGVRKVSPLHRVQISSDTHTTSYQVSIG